MTVDLHVKGMKTLKMNNMNFTDCPFELTGNGQVAKGFFRRGNGG
jgi:hypothetical protein